MLKPLLSLSQVFPHVKEDHLHIVVLAPTNVSLFSHPLCHRWSHWYCSDTKDTGEKEMIALANHASTYWPRTLSQIDDSQPCHRISRMLQPAFRSFSYHFWHTCKSLVCRAVTYHTGRWLYGKWALYIVLAGMVGQPCHVGLLAQLVNHYSHPPPSGTPKCWPLIVLLFMAVRANFAGYITSTCMSATYVESF